jgi:hypothetical protein
MPESPDSSLSAAEPRLTGAQIEAFVRDGYLAVPGLIPPEIVEESRAKMWDALGISPDDPSTWPESSIIVPHEVNPMMAPCRTPAVEAAAEQLAGPNFLRGGGFSPVLNFPRPGPPEFEPLGFHIDGIDESTLWPEKRYLVMLAYLTDASEYGGALAVRPGSHRQAFLHWIETDSGPNGSTVPPDLPYDDPVPVPGEAGDVVFLHYLLVHASSRNRASRVRVALNGTIRPDPARPYERKSGPPQPGWTPIDRTLKPK